MRYELCIIIIIIIIIIEFVKMLQLPVLRPPYRKTGRWWTDADDAIL